eukprot:scaffold18219_cov33-Tisochrysis_lutea.AAC.1
MTFLSPRHEESEGETQDERPLTWADAAERLAQLREMQELDESECVVEGAPSTTGGIVLLRHGESEWNAANRCAQPSPGAGRDSPRTALSMRPILGSDRATAAASVSPLTPAPPPPIPSSFTGWYDVPLTPRGELEALDAAATLRASGVYIDVVFTSTLKRTIKTAWLVLEALDRFTAPIHHRWQLNERMYGALTGLNKAETRAFLGEGPFEQLRRSPPPLERGSCYDPAVSSTTRSAIGVANGKSSKEEQEDPEMDFFSGRGASTGAADGTNGGAVSGARSRTPQVPTAESFEDTRDRVLPCWEDEILPMAQEGKTVLVVSSKNTLRSLIHGESQRQAGHWCAAASNCGLP